MSFHDETRSAAEFDQLRARDAASDPSAFMAEHEALRARVRRLEKDLKRALEAQESAEKSARWQKSKRQDADRAREKAEKKLEKATAKLTEAQTARDANRREVNRLKADLTRVRGSRTFRVGKAVLSPIHMFRSGPGASAAPSASDAPGAAGPAQQTADSSVPGASEAPQIATGAAVDATAAPAAPVLPAAASEAPAERPGPAPASAPDQPVSTPAAVPTAVPTSERSLDDLRREFREDPTPTTLYRVINRTWYGHGMIEEPAQLAAQHPELVAAMTAKQQAVVERVLGDWRISDPGIEVPPRAPGAVFPPERDRVMYCVHSTPVFNSNGYSTRTRGVALGLARAGADVRVVARGGYPWDHRTDRPKPHRKRWVQQLDGVPYIHLPGSGLGAVPMDRYIVEAADAFTREALLQRPELIQSASNYRTALPALIAARRVGVPFVYEVRGFWELSQLAAKPEFAGSEQHRTIADLETLVAREADHVLAITRQVRDDLVARGVPAERITLAPNAVDADEFLPLPKDARYAASRKIRTDVPVIGFAGSIVGYEGLETLVRASVALTERGVEHQVVIAGSGPDETALRELRSELDADRVTFLGRRPMEEMPRLLSTFDIAPIPRLSLAVTEMVSPLKPLESFSAMKAVLLSDVAPHRDLAGEGERRARLFRAGDAESLTDALESLILDADGRRDLGRAARLWVLDERTWSEIARSMRSAHRAVLAADAARDHSARPLGAIQVGLIADEFTTSTLSASMQIVPLDRERWREQLETESLDLVLVESAWSGNDGQWHRGIGDYGAQEHRDIRELLAAARQLGIVTAFWNKEDPIHISRFRSTAALCDHVFTTDADMIPVYLSTPGAVTRTASALPFYAQPAIHNPLPGARPYRHTVAYAGTYYGDRYKERSKELYRMLEASAPFGLTIYDRQAAYPDSPYRFPPEFARFSDGALPYDQVIDSYKSHLAHLNGNSVMDSPSMFSRRVVEIAACGGIALSGPGRGVEETFGGMIPVSRDAELWRILLRAWSRDPVERVREAWRQMRAVHRSHTVASAMTILMRTVGISVEALELEDYAVVLPQPSAEIVRSLLAQSHAPLEVFAPEGTDAELSALHEAGIAVRGLAEVADARASWIGLLEMPVGRTWFEDLLLAPRFGDWERIDVEIADAGSVGRTLAAPGAAPGSAAGLVRCDRLQADATVEEALRAPHELAVRMLVAPAPEAPASAEAAGADRALPGSGSGHAEGRPRTVLIAGHDLKFAGDLIRALEDAQHTVLIDKWENHTDHDEEQSLALLEQADTVFCEWGLGNAVWYSRHVKEWQRLIVRVHSQELFRPYLSQTKHAAVDAFVFVGELIRRAAVESHGVPAARTVVIPNPVRTEALDLPKRAGAMKSLGLVGIVPRSKRLDRALVLLEGLLEADPSYRLFIKGKRPEDYPWMAHRPDEMEWYGAQTERIERINAAHPGAVAFDPQGDDMPQWYQKIGIAVSVSDFESFHLTIADGAASGALPVSLAWAGSDLIYPREWLSATVADAVGSVLARRDEVREERAFVVEEFASSVVVPRLVELVAPPASS